MDRIKFYSINDMSNVPNLRNSIKIIQKYNLEKKPKSINDMLELYNIQKYFNNNIYLKEWTPEDIKIYEDTLNLLIKKVFKYFNLITDDNLENIYKEIEMEYLENFWELFNKFKVYKNISNLKFEEFIDSQGVLLDDLLTNKRIVEYFGDALINCMCSNHVAAEILLDEYEIKHDRNRRKRYFPKNLTTSDKENIIINYIDSEKPNLNYLSLICNIQSNKDRIQISPEVLLKAKRRERLEEKKLFDDDSGLLTEIGVGISKTQEEPVIFKKKDRKRIFTYSEKWLKENSDYPTLLNNFIYLFGYVDQQMRCTFVNKYSEMGVFERYLGINSKNAYVKGNHFNDKDIISLLQMTAYYNRLFSNGIRVEEIIEWFFKDYLLAEFNATNFNVVMPSANSTILEKCTSIMPALESVLNQFILFVKHGNIDFELLNIRTEHLFYKNIPSLVDKKYVYGIGEEFSTLVHHLFSDQSLLGYDHKENKSYTTFFNLMKNIKLYLDDCPKYCQHKINWLIERDYLLIDDDGRVMFINIFQIIILKDLFDNDVISYWKYPKDWREIINDLEKKKIIEFDSSLFSRPEQDYINYQLNKSQFNNGLDLKNKYGHTQLSYNDNNENIHGQNYMTFLRLFIICIIKINDDFCIAEDVKK